MGDISEFVEKTKQILEEQIDLLANWNEENMDNEPEQVRKNAETIIDLTDYILAAF